MVVLQVVFDPGGTLGLKAVACSRRSLNLKSLKSMPGHTFKAPDTNILKSDKSLRAADAGDGCLARTSKSTVTFLAVSYTHLTLPTT